MFHIGNEGTVIVWLNDIVFSHNYKGHVATRIIHVGYMQLSSTTKEYNLDCLFVCNCLGVGDLVIILYSR